MVEFLESFDTEPTGPCRKIMNRMGGYVREMIRMTEKRGAEQAGIVVELGDKIDATEVVAGEETSILAKTMAELRMDASGVASELHGPGNVNIRDYKSHSIHTHPNGHTEPSLTDIVSIIDNLSTQFPANSATSNLIAVDTGGGILLTGLYRKEPPTVDEIERLKTVANAVDMDSGLVQTISEKKRVLIDELEDVGYRGCAVMFPQRGV